MTQEVLIERAGQVGRIRLNRPKAIHALNTAMCSTILDALDDFEADDKIVAVLIDHAEGRGFCAGGDIRMLAESGKGDGHEAREFFHAEYRMNHRLFTYPKPTIAFLDGIVMGGGVGIALPCTYRIATENTRFAMPETGIGLFPDVGGGWFLPRLPGQFGKFMALTGYRASAGDCLNLGLATHSMFSDQLALVKELIIKYPRDLDVTISDKAGGPGPAALFSHFDEIDELFAGDSVEAIMAALEADGGDWALKELATLRSKSPLSMAVSLRQLREGAAMPDFAAEMKQEYAIGARVVHTHDFIEGVRALIVDKDNAPQWRPEVSQAEIDAIFAPMPAGEEWTPL